MHMKNSGFKNINQDYTNLQGINYSMQNCDQINLINPYHTNTKLHD